MFNDIEVLSNIGYKKYKQSKDDPFRFFMKAVVAGGYLGAAAILSYTLGAMFQDNMMVSKVLISSTFGIGLVAIMFLGAELFTGNCFTTMFPVFQKQVKFRQILRTWAICYVGNAIGMSIVCFIFIKSGAQSGIIGSYLEYLMHSKLEFDVMELFYKAILCNFIVCIASYSGYRIQDDTAKLIVIMGFVMAFVLPGFEHCIANAGIFTMGITRLGSSISWTALPWQMLIATIGNIIGGLSLAIPVYFVIRPAKEEN